MTKNLFDVNFFPKITYVRPRYSSCQELQLINTATTIKLIKLPQIINDCFDENNQLWKFWFVSFLNI